MAETHVIPAVSSHSKGELLFTVCSQFFGLTMTLWMSDLHEVPSPTAPLRHLQNQACSFLCLANSSCNILYGFLFLLSSWQNIMLQALISYAVTVLLWASSLWEKNNLKCHFLEHTIKSKCFILLTFLPLGLIIWWICW